MKPAYTSPPGVLLDHTPSMEVLQHFQAATCAQRRVDLDTCTRSEAVAIGALGGREQFLMDALTALAVNASDDQLEVSIAALYLLALQSVMCRPLHAAAGQSQFRSRQGPGRGRPETPGQS